MPIVCSSLSPWNWSKGPRLFDGVQVPLTSNIALVCNGANRHLYREHKMKFLAPVLVLFFSTQLWALTPEASVAVALTPAGDFVGKTSDVRGQATLVNGEYTAQNIIVGLKSIKTGVSLRDVHTQRHLQTDKFPEATLVSAKGKDGKGTGQIKIKGITKDIAGTFRVADNMLLAEFSLKLSDFEIKGIKYMGIGVENEVKIKVQLPIKK